MNIHSRTLSFLVLTLIANLAVRTAFAMDGAKQAKKQSSAYGQRSKAA